MGLEATEFSSLSGEAVASIGFLRYLTAYGTYGVNHLAATIRTTGASATSLHLSDDNSEDFHRDFAQTAYALGLQIQALPPFFSVSIENKTDGPVKSWFLKACVGI